MTIEWAGSAGPACALGRIRDCGLGIVAASLHGLVRGSACLALARPEIDLRVWMHPLQARTMAACKKMVKNLVCQAMWKISEASGRCATWTCGGIAWEHELVGQGDRLPEIPLGTCNCYVKKAEASGFC